MRKAVLVRSINRVLGSAVQVREAAYLWSRHARIVPYATVVFGAMTFFAAAIGIEGWPTRIVLGLAAAGIAVMATTEYRVLTLTDEGLYLLQASRIRQVAKAVLDHLPDDTSLQPIGGTVVAADWQVGARAYTVTRSYEQAMQRMAAALSA